MVDSKKTEDDAFKLLDKRAAKGGKWFEAICSALEEKYGESPMKYADSAAGESEDDPTWDDDEQPTHPASGWCSSAVLVVATRACLRVQ